MNMYVILVIFVVNRIVSAQDVSDETKYIDLLPDKEKAEFLERIARRIFNGVRSKDDRDGVSSEVSETQLDENDEFVKQVLDEESLDMRKSGGHDKKDENDEKINVDDHINNETIEKKDTHDNIDDSELVDLTLRDSIRNKRNSLAKGSEENSKIINVSVSNAELNTPKSGGDAVSKPDNSGTEAEDIQIKYVKRKEDKYKNELETATQSSSKSEVTKMTDFSAEAENGASEENVAAPEDKKGINLQEIQEESERKDENINDNDNVDSTKMYQSLEKEETVQDSAETSAIITKAIVSTTTTELTSPDVKPTVTTERLSLKNNNKDLDKKHEDSENYAKENVVTTDVIETEYRLSETINSKETFKSLEKSNRNMTEVTTGVTYSEQTTEKYVEVEFTTLAIKELTTEIAENENTENNKEVVASKDIGGKVQTKTDNKTNQYENPETNAHEEIKTTLQNTNVSIQEEKATKHEMLDENSYNLANDMIKALRTGIIPDNQNNFLSLQALYEATKPNVYEVNEVPEEKHHFVQKDQPDTTNRENPYYVPIYNYSPENAYYNPYNRLGPNADDDDDTLINLNDAIDAKESEDDNIDMENDKDNYDSLEKNDRESLVSDELTYIINKNHNKNSNSANNALENLVSILKKYKNHRKFRFGTVKEKRNEIRYRNNNLLPYKLNMPVVVQYPKFTDIYLNPNDYLDMDYYYGRSLTRPGESKRCELKKEVSNIFPDSTEKEHPYNAMNSENNLKDHLSSVRQILFRQKNFGFISSSNITAVHAEEEEKTPKEALRTNSDPKSKHPKQGDYEIAMDYFFGRMNDEADTETRTKEMTFAQNYKKKKKLNKILRGMKKGQRINFTKNNFKSKKHPFHKFIHNGPPIPLHKKKKFGKGPPPQHLPHYHKSPFLPASPANTKIKIGKGPSPQHLPHYHKSPFLPASPDYTKIKIGKGPSPQHLPHYHKSPFLPASPDYTKIKIGKGPPQYQHSDFPTAPPTFTKIIIGKGPSQYQHGDFPMRPPPYTKIKIGKGPPQYQHSDFPTAPPTFTKIKIGKGPPQYQHSDFPTAPPTFTKIKIGKGPPPQHLPHYHKSPLRAKKKVVENATNYALFKDILSMTNESDLLQNSLVNLKLGSAGENEELEPFLSVLEDMVRNDAKGLRQYDWLSTTVDLQSALTKLMDMTEEIQNNITIAQPDMQLLKYTIYLHKSTKTQETKQYRKNRLLPRNRKKKMGIIKESGLLNRHWLFRMLVKKHDAIITRKDLHSFNKFLNELQYALYDLHTAILQIANITNYNKQRWFENLKEIYIDTKKKHILEVLLHITTTRLLDLIERSAKNGAEDDFLTYIMKNAKEVERAKTEFAFVLKILDELKMDRIRNEYI